MSEKVEEVSIGRIISIFWKSRKLILSSVVIGAFFGCVVFALLPNSYETTATFLLEQNEGASNNSSLLKQVSGLTGLSFSSSTNSLVSPLIVKDIAQSNAFYDALLKEKVILFKTKDTVTVKEYYLKHTTSSVFDKVLGFPRKIKNAIMPPKVVETVSSNLFNDDFVQFTKEEYDITQSIMGSLLVGVDDENDIITMLMTTNDPYVSYQIVKFSMKYIENFITNSAIKKTTDNLRFVQKQFDNSKKRYHETYSKLANYRDHNKYVIVQSSKLQEKELTNDYDMAYSIYKSLASSLEQAKINLQENLPVIQIINSPQVAVIRTAPRLSLSVIISMILGGFVAFVIIGIKEINQTDWKLIKDEDDDSPKD